ncbi:MAG: hypothetical protein Q9183_004727 [Haloplaca sp. 2 TL-2023]
MKKILLPTFSQRSLLEQESIIGGVIDRFVRIIGEKAPPDSKGINMTKWYEMTSFDVLGELAFGESFHSPEAGKPHFWAEIIIEHLYFITLFDNLRRIGAIATLFRYLVPSTTLTQNKQSRYSREMVERRLAVKHLRQDFVSLLAKKVQEGKVEKEEMTAHVSTFVIAGGETVSIFLAGTTYFLLKYPSKLQKLTAEIRSAFTSYDSINAKDAQQLPCLQAVINEGLRLFPPASQGSSRISPGFELHGQYIPKGAEINVSPWTLSHNPLYFTSPMSFTPERWLDPHSTDIQEASQPFLLGTRSCIGRK